MERATIDYMALDPLHFAFWLHGFDEISGGIPPNAKQWAIIQDHLKLVMGVIPPAKTPLTSSAISLPTGAVIFNSDQWRVESEKRLVVDNADKVFITISRKPNYDGKSYSYYPMKPWAKSDIDHKQITQSLLSALGLSAPDDKVFVVVDNELNPVATECDALKGSGNHLLMPSKSGVGLLNIGTAEQVCC